MLYIILPVHNRKESTKNLIVCLIEQTFTNWHLILVDDGSTDGTEEMVRSIIPSVTVLKGNGHLWWGGSLHCAYKYVTKQKNTSNDLVLVLNNDVVFEKKFLQIGVNFILSNPKSMLLAQCYSKQTGYVFDKGIHINWKKFTFRQASTVEDINCLSTRGLLFYLEDFKTIGGFHPFLLPHYASDYEFTVRAYNIGMRLFTNPALRLFVDESTTGYRVFNKGTFFKNISTLFSIKCPMNPIVLSIFVLFACPLKWKLLCLIRIWKRTFIKIRGLSITNNIFQL